MGLKGSSVCITWPGKTSLTGTYIHLIFFLVGDDMRAKIADFGMVTKASDGKKSIESTSARDPGYLAPEYDGTEKVTQKMNVYAYGIILMELIIGKQALDETILDESCFLVKRFALMQNTPTSDLPY